jgi:hypothetical protein
MHYRFYQITLGVKHLYTNRKRCEMLIGYLSLGSRPGGDCTNILDEKFYYLLFKQELVVATVTSTFSSLTFTARASYRLGRHLTFTGRKLHLL